MITTGRLLAVAIVAVASLIAAPSAWSQTLYPAPEDLVSYGVHYFRIATDGTEMYLYDEDEKLVGTVGVEDTSDEDSSAVKYSIELSSVTSWIETRTYDEVKENSATEYAISTSSGAEGRCL